jgi:hypothetical protein
MYMLEDHYIFQLISEMSVNDLAALGHSIGFSPTLDNPKSAKYQSTYASTSGASGNGYNNNGVFSSTSDNQTASGDQNASTGNAANQYKIGRYVDITNTTGQGIYGNTNTLMTPNQLNSEFRPYYTTSGNYMYWHDYAVIKLNYLFESVNKIGLTKKLDAQLRLWVNTGTVMVRVGNADTAYRWVSCVYTYRWVYRTFVLEAFGETNGVLGWVQQNGRNHSL